MSSWVGPNPPVVIIRVALLQALLKVPSNLSLLSPTAEIKYRSIPSEGNWLAKKEELVSIMLPNRISVPMGIISAFTLDI